MDRNRLKKKFAMKNFSYQQKQKQKRTKIHSYWLRKSVKNRLQKKMTIKKREKHALSEKKAREKITYCIVPWTQYPSSRTGQYIHRDPSYRVNKERHLTLFGDGFSLIFPCVSVLLLEIRNHLCSHMRVWKANEWRELVFVFVGGLWYVWLVLMSGGYLHTSPLSFIH